MHILYGLSGEGSGHASRAREVIRYLQSQGHTVSVFTYDRGVNALKDEFDVHEIFGLGFKYKQSQLKVAHTVLYNIRRSPRALLSVRKIRSIAKRTRAQLIITDFEPLVVYVGHMMKLPILSIDNQHRITRTHIDYPHRYESDALSAKAVIELMTPQCDAYFITNFFEVTVSRPKTKTFPSLLRTEILDAQPTEGEHILVYVTSALDFLPAVLQQINQKFIVYGVLKSSNTANVTFKEYSHDEFIADLISCKAIIATAGFSLMSEALHLGKPMLAMPITGQFEQILNAYYLERAGYGRYAHLLDVEEIEFFLDHLKDYKKSLLTYERSDNSALFRAIDEFIETHA